MLHEERRGYEILLHLRGSSSGGCSFGSLPCLGSPPAIAVTHDQEDQQHHKKHCTRLVLYASLLEKMWLTASYHDAGNSSFAEPVARCRRAAVPARVSAVVFIVAITIISVVVPKNTTRSQTNGLR